MHEDNPYEPPSETAGSNVVPDQSPPFLGLPVALASLALGLFVACGGVDAIYRNAPVPRSFLLTMASVSASFLCLGVGSLFRNRRVFQFGWWMMLVWVLCFVYNL